MPRKRMIHPSIWEDPDFNNLSRDARLLFIGLISNADDEGYLRGDAGSLKRLIFGFDNLTKEQVEPWRKELEAISNIHFFDIKEEKYVHLVKWNTYQKQQKDRIQSSVYPMCSKCVADVKQLQPKDRLGKDRLDKEEDSSSSSFNKKLKPFFRGEEMRKKGSKWWVLPKDGGAWLEFAGKESEIEWK